ncbi:DUF2953 domain-containing protein [Clostridium sp. 19966]|uniref:DUF2953 domain-containing protein n=1 Tax=Clostridium sp. 19966 TaxID=2768166 RepID=UPI0028DD9D21|nr:DUF2953 domain-containing protein [Clostridium sp. 19966]MDT8716562.1 DUF2953 domain-containing protein [Clostridium sp. 19966]
MIFTFIALTVLIVLIMPLKIKLKTIYENNELQIYVFDRKVNFKKKHNYTENNSKKKKSELILKNGLSRLRKLINIKFKPRLDLSLEMHYGFEDAAFTGIFFGVAQNMNSFVYELLSSVFKIKNYKFDIIPNFNKPMLNFRINSIFSFNLVKIIYILIRIYI